MRTLSRLELLESPEHLFAVREEWNVLATAVGNPYLTAEWYVSWWQAFGSDDVMAVALRDERGALVAGACWRVRPRLRAASGAVNDETPDWLILATDLPARIAVCHELAARQYDRLCMPSMPVDLSHVEETAAALRDCGYHVRVKEAMASPFADLPADPASFDAQLSRGLRGTLARRRRDLDAMGDVVFETVTGGSEVARARRALFEVESSGWKGRAGTAIVSHPRTARLYHDVVERAASAGTLRLHLLSLDGRVVAADLGLTFAGRHFLVKTGFDEELARCSPGLLLRAHAIRAAIAEGCHRYEFLGMPDPYKMRWGSQLRRRVTLEAHRGLWKIVPAVIPVVRRVRGAAGALARHPRAASTVEDQ